MTFQRNRMISIGVLTLILLSVLLGTLFYFDVQSASANHEETWTERGCVLDRVITGSKGDFEWWLCSGKWVLESSDGAFCEMELFFWITDTKEHKLLGGNPTSIECPAEPSQEEEPQTPPSTWLAHVCEPEDGFSTAEYGHVITIGSDAGSKSYGTTLYYGASIDGPWTATTFAGPNYILTKTQIEGLTASVGLTDYHDLWLKVSDAGIPANLGSMIMDRAANIDSICNPE